MAETGALKIPQAAIEVVALLLHAFECPDLCEPYVMGKFYRRAEKLLSAAASHMDFGAGYEAGRNLYRSGAFINGRAAERDAIIRLAVEHGAHYYAEPRPCGHKADCSLVTRDRVPFAELIRKERGND